jgi:hypothetical protein
VFLRELGASVVKFYHGDTEKTKKHGVYLLVNFRHVRLVRWWLPVGGSRKGARATQLQNVSPGFERRGTLF